MSCISITFLKIPEGCFPEDNACVEKATNMILTIVIRFSITVYENILMCYTTEIYPTVVRGMGFSICKCGGKLGTVAMPIIVNYCLIDEFNPLFVFGCLGILVSILTCFLKETKNRVIPDFIEESK